MLDRLHEELVAIPLPCALDRKDEVIPPPAELDLAFKLGMPETLSADGVAHRILHHGLHFPCVAFIAAALLRSFRLGHLFKTDNAFGETSLELLGVGADDRAGDGDGWHEAVGGGCDG